MRTTSLGVRRATFVLLVLGVVAAIGWLVGGESSPFHHYFLQNVAWPNRLMAINFPAFLVAGLLSGNLHAPAGWAMLIGFLAQWLVIGIILSLVFVRPVARAGRSPGVKVVKHL